MTAAFDSRIEAMKEAAALRSLADQVASPVVAGRQSHRPLTDDEKKDWIRIVDTITAWPLATESYLLTFAGRGQSQDLQAKSLAKKWQALARDRNIGYAKWPLVGFLPIPGFWGLFLKLLIQLAMMYIESRSQQGRDSDR